MNLAAALQLPVLFVCENNLYATATPLRTVVRETDLRKRGEAYGTTTVELDGNDVEAVYAAAGSAVGRARAGGGPTFLICNTYRTVGHHEGDPIVGTYRSREELATWLERCPLKRLRERLIGRDAACVSRLDHIDAEAVRRIDAAIEFARNAPWPQPGTVADHVFATS
jgi:2-oxoisovalerate dehydrogenase E1 component